MRSSRQTRTAALLCVYLLLCAPGLRAQQGVQTRPRRVAPAAPAANTQSPTPTPDPAPPAVVPKLTRLDSEPTIRVGLATNARAVSISAAGQTLAVSSGVTDAAPFAPLPVARVRVEPRVFAPLPPQDRPALYQVEIAGFTTAAAAESVAGDVRALAGADEPSVVRDEATNSWRVRVGLPAVRAEADERRAQLEAAGFAAVTLVGPTNVAPGPATANDLAARTVAPGRTAPTRAYGAGDPHAGNNVRLTARTTTPLRGLVVYATGAAPLLDARTPITFAPPAELSAPLRLNDKPYRGRLEVFTNLNGSLTVVNVLGLEDYVRGVVPNELSPGGWPAVEALKAQAVAARTYAVSHRGQFAAQGFDVLPTTRSQVYGGYGTEQPLATRAVNETRGIIATYQGTPIDALYTSTCGGRTEDAGNIFGAPVPYLRGRECADMGDHAHASFAPFNVQTTRDPLVLHTAEHLAGARAAALLTVHGARLNARFTDDWLDAGLTLDEARALLETAARLARHAAPDSTADTLRPPGFSSALALALDGESRAAVLLDAADVDYLLAFRDAAEIPARNRADVALMLRDGHLALNPDATLRPRQPLPRARALTTVAHVLEARGLFSLQKVNARPATNGALVVRPGNGKGADRLLTLSPDAYLFRAYGETLYPVRNLSLVGGEPVVYHTDATGAVDYLEARPAPNGAASDRFSPFANWTTTLTAAEVAARLARSIGRVGSITDLRVVARGTSGRVTDLAVVGTTRTAHVTGGRVRSALGLREQLFVVAARTDDAGRATSFVFTGRGWGHGVGLCQVGAYGLARAGWTYDRILKNYYTGIDLTQLY